MAEEEPAEENQAADDSLMGGDSDEGGSKKKLIIIIAAVVLLLGGGGAGLYFTGMLDGLLGKASEEEMKDGEKKGDSKDKKADKEKGDYENDYGDGYGYEEYSDDYAEKDDKDGGKEEKAEKKDKGGKDGKDGKKGGGKYVVVPTMLVNLNTDDGTPRFLRLTIQIELKSKDDYAKVEAALPRVVDQFQTYLRELRVRDLRGSAGIYRLQMELLWRVNQAAKPVRVKDVLFQEILIQ